MADGPVTCTLSDEAVLAGLGSGDPGAAAAFVNRFQRRLFGMTLSVLQDRQAAEEAAQEAFVRAWRHASTYDPRKGTVAAWLLMIARNVSINMLPSHRSYPVNPEVLRELQDPVPSQGPDGQLARVSEPMRKALMRLPAEQRRVLVLAVFYGYTAREMSELDGMGCDRVRELVAELAIGIADGRERDAAMRHATTCPDCRKLLCELSAVVDDLLLLAPSHEPPPGFTPETVARIFPPSPGFTAETVARIFPPPAARRRRVSWPAARHALADRRWLPRLAVAASIVAALALGAGAVYQGTSSDRQLADSYLAVLAQGHGSFFAAAPLRGPAGTVGTAFGYQGSPSWLFAIVHLPHSATQRFDVQLVTRDGTHVPAGSAVLGGAQESWGAQIPVDLTTVTQLRFVAAGGRTTITANFTASNPWGPG